MTPKRRASDPEIEEIKTDVKDIKIALLGDIENKKDGFITRLRLTEQSVSRLWWFVGGLGLAIASKSLYEFILK